MLLTQANLAVSFPPLPASVIFTSWSWHWWWKLRGRLLLYTKVHFFTDLPNARKSSFQFLGRRLMEPESLVNLEILHPPIQYPERACLNKMTRRLQMARVEPFIIPATQIQTPKNELVLIIGSQTVKPARTFNNNHKPYGYSLVCICILTFDSKIHPHGSLNLILHKQWFIMHEWYTTKSLINEKHPAPHGNYEGDNLD